MSLFKHFQSQLPSPSRASGRARPILLAPVLALGALVAACGGGGGGTSPSPGDMNGSGATGDVAARGAITGFGSVIVEGERFASDQASITVNDSAADQAALRVGQIVDVRARRGANGSLVAERIRYDSTLVGPVQEIDLDRRVIVINGVEVRVAPDTVTDDVTLEELAPGDFIEISAERFGDTFVASFVEPEDPDVEVKLTGPVRGLDEAAQRFFIGAQEIDFSAPEEFDLGDETLADGLVVEVEGILDGALLRAREIEAEGRRNDDLEAGAELEVTGVVGGLRDDGGFVIQGFRARVTASTSFDDGSRDDFVNGARVKVEGVRDSDGVLVAEEVEFRAGGAPGGPTAAGRGIIELEGRVQSAAEDFVDVFGLRVAVDARTRISEDLEDSDERTSTAQLQPGDLVEIAAVAEAEGGPVALRVEREEPDADAEDRLRGVVDSTDGMQMLVVSGVDVATDSATEFESADDATLSSSDFFDAASEGDAVDVRGRFDGNLILAERIAFRNPEDEDFREDLEEDDRGEDAADEGADNADDAGEDDRDNADDAAGDGSPGSDNGSDDSSDGSTGDGGGSDGAGEGTTGETPADDDPDGGASPDPGSDSTPDPAQDASDDDTSA